MSSVFKPYQVRSVNHPAKIASHIGNKQVDSATPSEPLDAEPISPENALVEQMISDAQKIAEEIVRQANEEANQLKDQTQVEIEAWWQERRTEDEALVDNAKTEGYNSGYEEGFAFAEAEVQRQHQEVVQQAEQLIEQAFMVKNQIIAEAEPFLLELSVNIAEKIIHKQLTEDTENHKELIRTMLQRKREKGVITLGVAPTQFLLMNASREELSRSIDAQAELQIIPDVSVQDMGCVIRSSFGTIDARIDTQLAEIKKALLAVLSADEEVKE